MNRCPLPHNKIPERVSKVFKKHVKELGSKHNFKLMDTPMTLVFNVNSNIEIRKEVNMVYIQWSDPVLQNRGGTFLARATF